MDVPNQDEACYIISVAARLVNMHPQTLRYYERLGLCVPSRSKGRIRLYSARDVEKLKQIHGYVNDLGVNLAGVEVVLNLTERIAELEAEIKRLNEELEAFRNPAYGQSQDRGTSDAI